jgi:hypothetical protein
VGKLITTEIAVAYTNCPRKAFLLLNTGSPPPLHDYEAVCRACGERHRERYLARIRRDDPEAVGFDQDGLGVEHRYLVDVDLRAGDLSASSDLLVRTDQRSPSGGHSYCPQLRPWVPGREVPQQRPRPAVQSARLPRAVLVLTVVEGAVHPPHLAIERIAGAMATDMAVRNRPAVALAT